MGWFSKLFGATILSLTLAASASANTYDFSFSGLDVSGNGVITTGNGSSPYVITGVSGTILDTLIAPSAFTVTGLSSYASADNVLNYPTQPFVDFSGISFTTNGGGDFNIGFGPPYAIVSSILNPGGYFPTGPYTTISLQVSQTPLPASWTMMLSSLIIGFGFVLYKKAKRDGDTGITATA
jgi:hypothetical protein